MSGQLPALFIGHGNPMNALAHNVYTEAWRALGVTLPRPRAVLAISAHWYVPYVAVMASPKPRTIHDFGGFPRQLYEVEYAAPGAPALAERVRALLGAERVRLDADWGLDHGTWSVLKHLYPQADVPVMQLSIDETQPPAAHFALGRALRSLRTEGVLLLGSGNLVHNLHAYAWGRHVQAPYDWALRFESLARRLMLADDPQPLIDYERLGSDAALAAPTPDHYLPLLYVLGARHAGEPVSFPVQGVDGGSISMLSVQIA